MNHHVLYFRKMKFDMVMYAFCNLVRFREGAVWITGNLYVYIDFVSELAGAELINTKDAFLSFNTVTDHLFITIVTGVIDHFIHCIVEDVVSGFYDKEADNEAGNGIGDREAETRTGDTDESADGRECIGPVMPCICHQRGGINFLCVHFGIPEHCFFGND